MWKGSFFLGYFLEIRVGGEGGWTERFQIAKEYLLREINQWPRRLLVIFQ
jgi:hypothetical protein